MERVLPSAEVKELISSLAVGLAADCDKPEGDVEQLMRENLKGASTLPFVGFLSHDGKWVEGFSGHKDSAAFVKVLETVDQSPILNASDAVRKKLAALSATAEKAAAKSDWKSVMKAWQDASKTTGRCAERKALFGFAKQARDWASGQFDEAVKCAQAGGDLAPAKKSIADVKAAFAGEPEADEADLGLKAIARLAIIVQAEARGTPGEGPRAKAAAEFKDSRWTAVFEKAAAAPREEGPPGNGG